MTLRFFDGWDHYATADAAEMWSAFDGTSSGQSIASGAGRRGGNGWTCNTTGRGLTIAIPSTSTVILGFALNMGAAPASAMNIVELREVSTLHIALRINTDLSVSVLRNTTVLGTSASGVITATGFCYVELKTLINDSTGTYEVRVNGGSVLSGTGADTRNSGTSGVITVASILFARGGQIFDDFYICDGAGSVNNDFLGDRRVDAYFPSANGNSSQMVGSDTDSTDNYLLVDETSPNDDTDYVQSDVLNNKDTYTFQNMVHTPSSISGVMALANAKKDDAGTRSIAIVTRSGGADYDGSSHALSTSYTYYRDILETDPATSAAWSLSGFNNAEFGPKVAV
jgi:hypothetical protein